jgi:hypothetical protein
MRLQLLSDSGRPTERLQTLPDGKGGDRKHCGKWEAAMPSYWPGMLVVAVVAGSLIYLYRAEVRAFVSQLRKKFNGTEELKTVIADWSQTGYIDFSVARQVRPNPQLAEPHFFLLTIEEYRLVGMVGGGAAVERRWRRGSLADAREVAQNYYQFLQEHPQKAFNKDPRDLMTTKRLLDSPAA